MVPYISKCIINCACAITAKSENRSQAVQESSSLQSHAYGQEPPQVQEAQSVLLAHLNTTSMLVVGHSALHLWTSAFPQ